MRGPKLYCDEYRSDRVAVEGQINAGRPLATCPLPRANSSTPAGVLPVGSSAGGGTMEIIRGDAYYQSYICHIPRSTVSSGSNGPFDCWTASFRPPAT